MLGNIVDMLMVMIFVPNFRSVLSSTINVRWYWIICGIDTGGAAVNSTTINANLS